MIKGLRKIVLKVTVFNLVFTNKKKYMILIHVIHTHTPPKLDQSVSSSVQNASI